MPANPTPPASAELLHRLVDRRIDFIVVGGVAAVLQGASILTVDLDLCIPFSTGNLSRLLPLLVELDARFRAHPDRPRLTADVEHFAAFRLLLLETVCGPVDFLREITGIGAFDEVARASTEIDLGEFRCRVLGLEGLIATKRAVGRDKDLRVLAELEATLRLRSEGS
ncbi:MAG: hypothetical protein ABI689_15000 [Thermoanaerobaculia bacterium]